MERIIGSMDMITERGGRIVERPAVSTPLNASGAGRSLRHRPLFKEALGPFLLRMRPLLCPCEPQGYAFSTLNTADSRHKESPWTWYHTTPLA